MVTSLDMVDHVTIAGVVFIVHLLQRFFRFWWKMIRCYALTKIGFVQNLRQYGEWVVITGATDGIGKEYARQFAKQGMKIVLISRTKGKLENVAKEIENEFKVETKVICFDFKQMTGYDIVENELTGIDIGVLVNNVATAVKKRVQFAEKDINLLMDTVHCNVISEIRMTHIILKGMLERGRGLVVHVSSSTLFFNLKYCITYPATKAFVASFWKALRLEDRGVIGHQLVTPFVVSTNDAPAKNICHAPTARAYVTSAIRTIGITDNTCGYWFHEIQKCVYQNVPECIATLLVQIQLYYLYKQSKLKKR